jgi:hypothetical protein
MCRAEEAGGFAVTAGVFGETREAFEDVGEIHVRPGVGCAGEGIVGVAFPSFWLTQRDRHAHP